MAKAYKYRGGIGILDAEGNSIFERDINTIVDNKIYLPTKCSLNDPTEGFYNDIDVFAPLKEIGANISSVVEAYEGLKQKFESVGVYSLSKDVCNELLWAYYASGHTGFAIEYDIEKLKETSNYNKYFTYVYDFDVDYVDQVPTPNFFDLVKGENEIQIYKTFLGSKSTSWSHEKEYRLLIDKIGLWEIDYRAITGIYFGCRMKEEEIAYVMDKLKGRNLRYYQMILVESSYTLYPKEIEDKHQDAPEYIANTVECNMEELLLFSTLWENGENAYKDKLIEAIELVKKEPLITKIYTADIRMVNTKPKFIIWAYTKCECPPTRNFNFMLDEMGKLYKVL